LPLIVFTLGMIANVLQFKALSERMRRLDARMLAFESRMSASGSGINQRLDTLIVKLTDIADRLGALVDRSKR
jgi:hypothetical protein